MHGGGTHVCIIRTGPSTHELRTHELHRAGSGSWSFHGNHVSGPPPCTAQFQRYFGRRRCGGVHRQRIRYVGTDLSSAGNASGLSWPEVVPSDWRRVAHARSLGFASPFWGPPDLALHADFFPWLHGIRHTHRGLVAGWRTFHHSGTRSEIWRVNVLTRMRRKAWTDEGLRFGVSGPQDRAHGPFHLLTRTENPPRDLSF